MKLLTFSSLYPSSLQPRHGIFVEQRLTRIVATENVSAQVVAPIPWFPFTNSCFGRYAVYARTPADEWRNDLLVSYPRYFHLPKIGMSIAPLFMALSCYPLLRKIRREYAFDLIDAHYFYPDGVAAVLLGKMLGVPVVITGRGSDLNVLPRYRIPRHWIRWAAAHAVGLITVCEALKDKLLELGLPGDKVTVLRNGVDLELFHPPEDREVLRTRMGLSGTVLLSVGNLVALKGHETTITALQQLPNTMLLLVGEGPQRDILLRLADSLGLRERIRFVGNVPQSELADYYGIADALVLSSRSEGMANVLLESLACGTPVVATDVGGAREIVTALEAGTLVGVDNPDALAIALSALLGNSPDRQLTRRHAENFSWDATVDGQLALYQQVLGKEDCLLQCQDVK